ncbi:hypothetical protein [Chryseobacterium jejuense]|uniref:Lipocalin-like domain-containing protein n=1 Tax=Chryseobacterium jejuense TaxID=445960 RepID=A0ABY0Q470_CHRJE|nr:hypothetical protein [Chryseobacterium jejuense]SDJ49265.1 hypothetical protein SAMN05421542_3564 [Chryseobacterium jejuense]
MNCQFFRKICIKRLIYIILILSSSSFIKAQVVNVSGNWNASIPAITEAGSNYTGTYDNSGNTAPNLITLSGTLPGSFLNLLSSSGAKMTMRYTPNPWNNSLTLSAKRTGGTTAIHGLCVLCTASINGGANYIPISQTGDTTFITFTFSGVLGVGNSVTFADINLIVQLAGVSVTVPSNTYSARIVFTIVAN